MRNHPSKGFTLVELLVSIAIFAIVALAATAAYLSFINYSRLAQSTATVINSLYFAVDGIARDVRTGNQYTCGGGGCNPSGSITFSDETGKCVVTYQTYDFVGNSACVVGNPHCSIARSAVNLGANVCPSAQPVSPITNSSITILSLAFYIRGNVAGDNTQPIATAVINGYACLPNSDCTVAANQIPFQVETSATQRLPDL
jgi:prepilin-type N-terminal cleavage/methylation domain-containing protein